MEISKPSERYLNTEQLCLDLQHFLRQPVAGEFSSCPGCQCHIPVQCSADCPDAPEALSIDPVKYPIETSIVPLVYAIMSTNVFQTCWSCEGHMNDKNELWKLPNVSFYSESAIYPQLLLRHIGNLQLDKVLRYHWNIVLADYAQTCGITYSIQPNLTSEENIHLGLLQKDVKSISDNMSNKLKIIAHQFLQELNQLH